MFFFKGTKINGFWKKPLKSCFFDDLVRNTTRNIIASRPRWFCHLWMCSPEVLDGVRDQKQLLTSRKQKYFCTRSCPEDTTQGVRIGPGV